MKEENGTAQGLPRHRRGARARARIRCAAIARSGPFEALALGASESWHMTVLQAKVFGRMLMGQVSLKNLSGPLTIAEYAGDSAQLGRRRRSRPSWC